MPLCMTANAPTSSLTKDFYSKEKPALNTCLLGGIILLMSMAACDRGLWKPNLNNLKGCVLYPVLPKQEKSGYGKRCVQISDVKVQLCRHCAFSLKTGSPKQRGTYWRNGQKLTAWCVMQECTAESAQDNSSSHPIPDELIVSKGGSHPLTSASWHLPHEHSPTTHTHSPVQLGPGAATPCGQQGSAPVSITGRRSCWAASWQERSMSPQASQPFAFCCLRKGNLEAHHSAQIGNFSG